MTKSEKILWKLSTFWGFIERIAQKVRNYSHTKHINCINRILDSHSDD